MNNRQFVFLPTRQNAVGLQILNLLSYISLLMIKKYPNLQALNIICCLAEHSQYH